MQAFSRAAEGIRTLDLLHGKQLLKPRFPAQVRVPGEIRCDRIAFDYREFWYRKGYRGSRRCRRTPRTAGFKPDGTSLQGRFMNALRVLSRRPASRAPAPTLPITRSAPRP